MAENGVEIVLCTGRMPGCVYPVEKILDINCSLVTFNGALAFSKKSIIWEIANYFIEFFVYDKLWIFF